ncbi:restriction endonuclease subunit S [Methanomethylophilus alvi]|uniref:restriction endonuclease subunit S n=1 Tax=Methanomethylophilus alvi TaxID=1291540 RepID=UPI0037DCD3E1
MNTLREFIHPYKAKKAGNSTYPILSITKDYGIVLQDEKFKKRIASVDTSSYKIVPRGLIVQGIHIDERNFGVQDLVEEGIVSPAYKLWSVNVDRADPYVVAYAMRSDYLTDYIESKFRGSIRRREHITDNDLLDAPANIPSMKHQKIFLEFVKQAEKSKTICKQIFQSLDNLVKSRFNEMFGGHTELSRWPCYSVADVCSVKVGVVIKPAQYYTLEKDGIKTFRSLNIGENCINDKEWVYFTKEGNECNKRTVLKENDVIVARSGLPGVACVIPKEYEGCNAVDVIIATPNTSRVNPYYLAYYTNSPHGKQQIVSRGAAQQHFNVGSYEKVTLALPPLELQNEFVDFVKQVDKSKFVETVEPDHPAVFQNVHGFPSFGLIST